MNNQYAITAHEEACTALAFARGHDWGKDAELGQCLAGGFYLEGLVDAYTLNGVTYEKDASVPATMNAVREFGGY